MGILVNIVSADEDDIEAIGESLQPVNEWDGIEARDIDKTKFILLHCLLTGDGIEDAVYAYEPVYFSGEDAPQVLRMPDELTEKLASLDEEALEIVGEELAATEDFELSDLQPEEVVSLVIDLAEVARGAVARGQTLFIWMHPLLT